LAELEVDHQVSSNLPNCITVQSENFVQHEIYQEGLGLLMNAASQEVAYLADVTEHRRLVDFCAAPGGKSFILASRMARQARLLCCDINLGRLQNMASRAKRMGIQRLDFVNADLTDKTPLRGRVDFVLVDVPCSGLGTLRSRPDIRWRIEERDLQRYHSRQLALLQHAFSILRRGGEAVYSTCSTEPEENEQVVEEFLAGERGASLNGEYFRTFPESHSGDCFFAARIGRK